jgi:hypothetical protein
VGRLRFTKLRRVLGKTIQTCDQAIHDFDLPYFVRAWLLLQRMPAVDKNLLEVSGFTPSLFATWDGKRVKATMASRFGDIGVTTDLDGDSYQHRVMLFELSEFSGSKVVALTPDESHLVSEALDSHIYWQLSDYHYRRDGYVDEPGSDDPEKVAEIKQAEALQARFD